MANFRSPNYPALSLRESYQRTKALWAKERRTAVPADVAARAIGYNGLSGPSRTALAAMKKYGLADNEGSNVKVSELAIELIHSTNDNDSLKVLRQLALKPELFGYLYANYRHASDDAIRAYLIAKLNFSDSGALQAIKAYRDTFSFAQLDDPEYNPQVDPEEPVMETTQNTAVAGRNANVQPVATASLSNQKPTATSQSFSWPLGSGLKAEVNIIGGELEPRHCDALKKYLDIAKEQVIQTFGVGDAVEFEDAYTHEIKWGRISQMHGNTSIVAIITKEEAGPNPKRFSPKPDPRIAEITGGTGVIKNPA